MPERVPQSVAARRVVNAFRMLVAMRRAACLRARRCEADEQQRREGAAIVIQALVRGHLQRHKKAAASKAVPAEDRSMKKIVWCWRAYRTCRSFVSLLRTQRDAAAAARCEVVRSDAATVIAGAWRRAQCRALRCANRAAEGGASERLEQHSAACMVQRAWHFHRSAATRRSRKASAVAKRANESAAQAIRQEQEYAAMLVQRAAAASPTLGRRRSQRRTNAARLIQTAWRRIVVQRALHVRLCALQAAYCQLIKREAVSTIAAFVRHAATKLRIQRRRQVSASTPAEDSLVVRQERAYAATVVQMFCRACINERAAVRLRAVARAALEMRSAIKIQSLFRRMSSMKAVLMLRSRQKRVAQASELVEIVVVQQAIVRGVLARSRFHQQKRAHDMATLLARLYAGFVARMGVATRRCQVAAARKIQRCARMYLAVRRRRAMASKQRDEWQWLCVSSAAFRIQRVWRHHAARRDRRELLAAIAAEDVAVVTLQRAARRMLAKRALQRLLAQKEVELEELLLERAAVTAQSLVRGHLARVAVTRIRTIRATARSLLADCARGFATRLLVHRAFSAARRDGAAAVLQRAWRQRCAYLLLLKRRAEKLALLERLRQRERAATNVQKVFRKHRCLVQHNAVIGIRKCASLVLQCFARALLSRAEVGARKHACRRAASARIIQQLWLRVCDRVKLKREERDLERRLIELQFTSVHKHEAARRAQLQQEEEEEHETERQIFVRRLAELQEQNEARLSSWRARAPPELQAEAAVTLQAQLRGFVTRKRLEICKHDEAVHPGPVSSSARRRLLDLPSAHSALARPPLATGLRRLCGRSTTTAGANDAGPPASGAAMALRPLSQHEGDDAARASRAERLRLLMQVSSNPAWRRRNVFTERDDDEDDDDEDVGGGNGDGGDGGTSRGSVKRTRFDLLGRPIVISEAEKDATRHLREDAARAREETFCQVAVSTSGGGDTILPVLRNPWPAWIAQKEGQHVARCPNRANNGSCVFATESGITRVVRLLDREFMARRALVRSLELEFAGLLGSDPWCRWIEAASSRASSAQPQAHQRLHNGANELPQLRRRRKSADEGELRSALAALAADEAPGDAVGGLAASAAAERNFPCAAAAAVAVLDLQNRGLTEVELRQMLHALRSNTHVTSVNLSGNAIRDACCIDIADTLNHNPLIEELCLADNPGITDVGATQLIAALRRRDCRLRCLDLAGTSVTLPHRRRIHQLLRKKLVHADGRSSLVGVVESEGSAGRMKSLSDKVPEVHIAAVTPPRKKSILEEFE